MRRSGVVVSNPRFRGVGERTECADCEAPLVVGERVVVFNDGNRVCPRCWQRIAKKRTRNRVARDPRLRRIPREKLRDCRICECASRTPVCCVCRDAIARIAPYRPRYAKQVRS